MTYRELAQLILKLKKEWLDSDVSIHIGSVGEFFEVCPAILHASDNGVLDEGHPYLQVSE